MRSKLIHSAFLSGTRLMLAGAILAPGGWLMTAASRSEAAVRLCAEAVIGEAARDAVELAAKKRALESWTARAKARQPNPSWRIAADKDLTCVPAPEGLFECVARGRPCTVKQVPPGGALPLKKIPIAPR